jgi:hypothetical protein
MNPMGTETRIIIADDHPIFRQGLGQIIDRDPALKVIAEAEDGEAALEAILRQLDPRQRWQWLRRRHRYFFWWNGAPDEQHRRQ